MGSIAMSTTMAPAVVSRFMMLGQTAGSGSTLNMILGRGMLCSHSQSVNEVGARFAIMKGTVPADFSTLTSFNARSADLLVMFDTTTFTSSTGTNAFQPSQTLTNPFVLTTVYVNATNSGTATWFWWFTTPLQAFNVFNNTVTPYNQIVGTVGITGSGADLVLPSVAISAGSPYRIFNYRLQIPTSWTF